MIDIIITLVSLGIAFILLIILLGFKLDKHLEKQDQEFRNSKDQQIKYMKERGWLK